MKQLSTQVLRTTKSGNYQYALVESITKGLVTIRLGKDGSGARLTNLNVVGTVEAGDVVIVDYSTHVPYVRAMLTTEAEPTPLEMAPIPLEFSTGSEMCEPYSLSHGESCGRKVRLNADASCTFGSPVYASSGGYVLPANATTLATAKVIAMAADDSQDVFLVDGFICNSNWSLYTGEYAFLSTSGGLTTERPVLTDECVVVLGVAITPTIIRFEPELVIVELL